MARIDIVSLRDWNNGEIMNEQEFEREREIIRVAINDNYDRLLLKYDKTEVDSLLAAVEVKADDNSSQLSQHKTSGDHDGRYYTEDEMDGFLAIRDSTIADKADKATTYTKTEVDNSLALKADKATTYMRTELYTQTEVDSRILNSGDVGYIDGGSFLDVFTNSTLAIDGGEF